VALLVGLRPGRLYFSFALTSCPRPLPILDRLHDTAVVPATVRVPGISPHYHVWVCTVLLPSSLTRGSGPPPLPPFCFALFFPLPHGILRCGTTFRTLARQLPIDIFCSDLPWLWAGFRLSLVRSAWRRFAHCFLVRVLNALRSEKVEYNNVDRSRFFPSHHPYTLSSLFQVGKVLMVRGWFWFQSLFWSLIRDPPSSQVFHFLPPGR